MREPEGIDFPDVEEASTEQTAFGKDVETARTRANRVTIVLSTIMLLVVVYLLLEFSLSRFILAVVIGTSVLSPSCGCKSGDSPNGNSIG